MSKENEIKLILIDLKNDINETKDLEQLKKIKSKYLFKSDFFNELKKSIKTTDNKKRFKKRLKLFDFYSLIIAIVENKMVLYENMTRASYAN